MDDGGDSGSSTESTSEAPTPTTPDAPVMAPAFASHNGFQDSGNRGRRYRSGGAKRQFDWAPFAFWGVVLLIFGAGVVVGRYVIP